MALHTPRDAEATRRRLLAAASAEFARYGIAGARVDRIASAAKSNKAQIYHYFGNKDGLFDAVFGVIVNIANTEAPMDPADLPEYAGRLFDAWDRHPEIARLVTWYHLERGSQGHLIQAVLDSTGAKVDGIAAAQKAGVVSDAYPPVVLLGLVIHIAALWTFQTSEYQHMTRRLSTRRRRQVVTDSVRTLTAPIP